MLVISRNISETVRIDEDISITVLAISKGVIKLGIAAPPRTIILRGELYEQNKLRNPLLLEES